MSRRLEFLVDEIRRSTESVSNKGFSDLEIIYYLNEAQEHLYSEIVKRAPKLFTDEVMIDVVADQTDYDLPSDCYNGAGIIAVEIKWGINDNEYVLLPARSIYLRRTDWKIDLPFWYDRMNSKIRLSPMPNQDILSGLRVRYQKKLRTLDIRRGVLSNLSKTGSTLNTLTIDLTPPLGKDDGTVQAARDLLNKADYISIVAKDGTAVLTDIPVDSYDSTTGIITVGTVFDPITKTSSAFTTTLTGPDLLTHYVVVGFNATTHLELDSACERYLINHAQFKLLSRLGVQLEPQYSASSRDKMEEDILRAYEEPDQDMMPIAPDPIWSGESPYDRPSISSSGAGGGGGGSSSTPTYSAANVGTAGVGPFKQLTALNVFQFKNVESSDGSLSVTNNIIHDTIDLSVVSFNIHALTPYTSPLALDEFISYSTAASANRKITYANFEAGLTLNNLIGPLNVSKGGTGLATLTAKSLYVGNGTSAPTALGVATNGQLPIGSTGANPVLAVLTPPPAGLGITIGAGSITFGLLNDLAALEGLSSTGIAVRSATDTWVQRSIIQPAAGVVVTNGDGVSGNPTLSLANDLGALEALSTTGIATRTASDTWSLQAITNHCVQVGGASSTITQLTAGTTGQLLIGSTGADPAFGTSIGADITVTTSTAGATRTLTLTNTDNTNTASNSAFVHSVGGTSSGDAYSQFAMGSSRSYAVGPDTSDSQKLKINTGANATTTPSSGTNLWTMTSAGARTMPAQPCFMAHLTGNATDVTGDGTTYTLITWTSDFDQASNFNVTSGTFTAPVAGRYIFTYIMRFNGLAVGHTSCLANIVATAGTFQLLACNPNNVKDATTGAVVCSGALVVNMAASDTATINLQVSNSTKTADIVGGTGATYFGGYLLV